MYTYPNNILKKLATDSIPELKDVDFYLEQDSSTDKNSLQLASPGLYFEYALVGSMRMHGNNIQSGIVNITLHLVTVAAIANGKRMKKDQPTDHMAIFDKVYRTFNGFSSKLSFLPEFVALLDTDQDERVMNSLCRTGMSLPQKFKTALMKSTQTFQCVIYDHASGKQYTSPQPNIDVQGIISVEELMPRVFGKSFDESFH